MTKDRFEFETGFVDVSGPEVARRGVHGAAVAKVAADAAKALAAVQEPLEWDNGGEFALLIVVVGPDVDGLALDSCARVVMSALRIVGLVESEASFSLLSVVRHKAEGATTMKVLVDRPSGEESLKAKLRRADVGVDVDAHDERCAIRRHYNLGWIGGVPRSVPACTCSKGGGRA